MIYGIGAIVGLVLLLWWALWEIREKNK